MAVFTHVVPLGANCRVTQNLRRHFDYAESFPFDWWILPLPALLDVLASDFDLDRLYDPSDMDRVGDVHGAHLYVRHRSLGIHFAHEFPRMPAAVAEAVAWEDHVQKPRERMRYLAAKLRGLNRAGHSILFVRSCLTENREFPRDTGDDLAKLREQLARQFHHAAIDLLPVSPTDAIDGVATLTIDDRSEGWKGDFALWSAALASTGHSLTNPGLHPFVSRVPDIDHEGALPPAVVDDGRAPSGLVSAIRQILPRWTRSGLTARRPAETS